MDAANGFKLTNPNNAHGIDFYADDLTIYGGGLGYRKIITDAGDLSIDPVVDLLLQEGGGKVGIGTASPGGTLEIQSSAITDPNLYINSNYDGVQAGSLTFRHGRTAGALNDNDMLGDIHFQGFDDGDGLQNFASIHGIAAAVNEGAADGVLYFNTYVDGTNAERMRIHSNGNIGIGTNAPNAAHELHVEGVSYARSGVIGSCSRRTSLLRQKV